MTCFRDIEDQAGAGKSGLVRGCQLPHMPRSGPPAAPRAAPCSTGQPARRAGSRPPRSHAPPRSHVPCRLQPRGSAPEKQKAVSRRPHTSLAVPHAGGRAPGLQRPPAPVECPCVSGSRVGAGAGTRVVFSEACSGDRVTFSAKGKPQVLPTQVCDTGAAEEPEPQAHSVLGTRDRPATRSHSVGGWESHWGGHLGRAGDAVWGRARRLDGPGG